VRRYRARLRAVSGVRHLLAGRDREARVAFVQGGRVLRDWRLLGAAIGLMVAPRATRRLCLGYLARYRMLGFPGLAPAEE
jgi:hypothetical protein